jgi:ABC-2 type transport system permease protein
MEFIKQIGNEMRILVRAKFLLVLGILMLLSAVAAPVVILIMSKYTQTQNYVVYSEYNYEKAYSYRYGYDAPLDGDSITVDGVTISSDNPYYWNIRSLLDGKSNANSGQISLGYPESMDLLLELMDAEISYYVRFARQIASYDDYRAGLAWSGVEKIDQLFVLSHMDTAKPDALFEVAQYRLGMDSDSYKKQYTDLSAQERLTAQDDAETYLATLYKIVDNNDFALFIQLSIQQQNDYIADYEDQIEIYEQSILDNPSQEKNMNEMIEQLRKQIEIIRTNTIPMLEYRLEKNIVPGADIWQNNAISDIENSRSQIAYTTIVSEEEFNETSYLVSQYKTYARYVSAIQTQIDKLNNTIYIAQASLDADAPDMKYVNDGARIQTVKFLNYSIFVAMFSVLVGGWIMASEYQQGTIRLLMIRPKTRTKILMSKFFAALLLCLAMYAAGCLVNIVVNGACFGFSDYAYPNYAVSGKIGFFAYYLPRFLACTVTVIFAFSVAFMLSVLIRNTAVSIAVPIVCYIGCTILTAALSYSGAYWLAYTPIPYVQIASFFIEYSSIWSLIQNGVQISLWVGIPMLLVLAALFTGASALVFAKRDIAN